MNAAGGTGGDRRRGPADARGSKGVAPPRRGVVESERAKGVRSRRRRGLAMAVVFALMAVVLSVRLADLQFFNSDAYVEYGQQQRIRTVKLTADRGRILDRNGSELAVSVPQWTIWADPSHVDDPAAAAAALAPVLDMDEQRLLALLSEPDQHAYLARTVPDRVAWSVADLSLTGVYRLEESARFNPAGARLGQSVVGTVDVDQRGISGLEYQFDELLGGVPGEMVLESSHDGRTIPTGARHIRPAQPGADLHLTIDRSLQFEAERALKRQIDEVDAQSGTVVIMVPATGEILAMASVGRDDEGEPVALTENRAVTWAYEPGSVMKSVALSGVIEEELGAPHHVREVNHWIELYDQVFTDHTEYGTVLYSMEEILARSSNTGTVEWALVLGSTRLAAYLSRFGLGWTTGLGFKGESAGLVPQLLTWSGTDVASFALGQGILATPLQVLMVYNTLANDGVLVPPTLVRSAVDAEGREVALDRGGPVRVVSERTASQMTDMLVTAVREGTGRNAQVDGYTIAGKTGTGQKVLSDGNYEDSEGFSRYTATFAGFYPAEDPQLSMIVVIDEPVTNFYASQAAAPLFADLAKYSLQRLRIAPPVDFITVPPKLGPAPTPQPVAEPTPTAATSEPAPDPAPESAPTATPEPAPESAPTATPELVPESAPAATAELVPESAPAAIPQPEAPPPDSEASPQAEAGP
ncbi:penicillin-binding transpeptidase domain-containing protein [Candidatus Poriferisocius sp.]|uniref:penicillin-binding transpeptidase domain-containing protein n=1 Tax=Candidatus Poriferisocius sp. TaxID=3101276 RepID=UPI003B590CA5